MSIHKPSKPIPVKLDAELLQRIEDMAKKMGEAKSTVMRIAMRVGLENLESVFNAEPGTTLSSLISRSTNAPDQNDEKPAKKKAAS